MKFALIGKKLGHSYSAIIHNAEGLDYSLKEIPENGLENFLTENEFDGFNVTIPYKKAVMRYLDEISDEALKIGAVNTVKKVDGKLYGFNTDYYGLELSMKRGGITVGGKNVLVLGSGGAGATAICYAENNGAKSINVVSRNGEINYKNVYEKTETQIIINTTPVGMFPDNYSSVIDSSRFLKLEAAVDFIYNPCDTPLIASAKKRGLKYATGLPILVGQALEAENIWLDKTRGSGDFERVLSALYKKTLNLVLIGMPGSGKSKIGKLAADRINRKFYDCDEVFYDNYKISPADFISFYGEKEFREKETATLKELMKNTGAVIATGGGAVLKEENVTAMKSNAAVIYIRRDLNKLALKGRPLSKSDGVEKLYAERKEKYEAAADGTVYNDFKAERVAKEIIKAYETACDKRR